MITINVTGRKATKAAGELITSGSVGMEVQFTFDDAWDGLSKIACFSGSADRDQLPTDNVCKIPWECLKTSGRPVVVGVYGADGTGAVVIPTVYCNLGMVQRGAKPSNSSSQAATATAVDQMLGYAQTCTTKATAAATSANNSAVNASMSKINANTALSMARQAKETADTAKTTAEAAQAAVAGKQDKLTAGTGITLNGSTISADSQVFIARNSGSSITTFDELLAAYNARKNITAQVSGSSVMNNGARRLPLSYARTSGDNAQFAFTSVSEERTADGTSELRKLVYAICRPSGWTSGMKDITNIVSSVNGVTPDNNGNVNVSGGGSTAWSDITGKPGSYPPSSHQHTVSQISDFPSIPAAVTDEHINGLIDAKIGSLEELSASVLELIGDEVSG